MQYRIFVLIVSICAMPYGAVLQGAEEKSTAEREFCRLDRNNDQKLTFDEFSACEFFKLEHLRALPFMRPGDMEPEKSGRMTDEGLKAFLFKKADRDQDQRINRREWEEFYDSITDQGMGPAPSHRDSR